jgi:hypothetical protein
VEVLPEAIQQQVREGKIPAQVALKFLVPVARQSLQDCQRMAAIFAQHHCDTRARKRLADALNAERDSGGRAHLQRARLPPALFPSSGTTTTRGRRVAALGNSKDDVAVSENGLPPGSVAHFGQ